MHADFTKILDSPTTAQREGGEYTLAADSRWMQTIVTDDRRELLSLQLEKKEEWHKQKTQGETTRVKKKSLCVPDLLQTVLLIFGLHLDQISVLKHKVSKSNIISNS